MAENGKPTWPQFLSELHKTEGRITKQIEGLDKKVSKQCKLSDENKELIGELSTRVNTLETKEETEDSAAATGRKRKGLAWQIVAGIVQIITLGIAILALFFSRR